MLITKYPRQPAAFINVIAEEGTKEEAVQFLQETWDELCFVRQQLCNLRLEVHDYNEKLLRKFGPILPTKGRPNHDVSN